uniref:Uncharacterized protein n=1 Tax=Rhizophora mucronata TaxID=61149 RepID=A0A2P2PPM2_RHIMU
MGSLLYTSICSVISWKLEFESSIKVANLVFHVGFSLPETSTLVQYLLLGSIHPTANH